MSSIVLQYMYMPSHTLEVWTTDRSLSTFDLDILNYILACGVLNDVLPGTDVQPSNNK